MVLPSKDLPANSNQICWLNQIQQHLLSCRGALKRKVQHVCSAISLCLMANLHPQIHAMCYVVFWKKQPAWVTPVTPTQRLNSFSLNLNQKKVWHQYRLIKVAISITHLQLWAMIFAAKQLLCWKRWASLLNLAITKAHLANKRLICATPMP